MTSNGYSGVTFEGVVEATNERGLKLNGDWLNVSKFKPLELPSRGSMVRVTVDAKGFLSAIDVLDDATPAVSRQPDLSPRLAVLQAAAAFGASRPDLKSADVLRIAESWLAWVQDEECD